MIPKNKCTGCSACTYSCPSNAISIETDNLTGFKIAAIDTNKCVNCGKCESICPQTKENTLRNASKRYVLRACDNILKKSSSGGAFTLLTTYLFRKGFKHVVGVKWDENFNAVYSIATTPDGWREFRGSKYMQADTGEIFPKIKTLLDRGEKVLFTGIPCHVAGLLNYLGKKYNNLITIDLLCSGLPSPLVWQKWLKEEGFDTNDIKSINMRHKNGMGSLNPTLRIVKTDDSVYDINLKSSNFYRLTMARKLLINESCYYCKFKDSTSHASDFTIGDLRRKDNAGYDENDSNLSQIICNNNRSLSILEKTIEFYENSTDHFENISCNRVGQQIVDATRLNDVLLTRSIKFNRMFKGDTLQSLVKVYKNKYPYDIAIAGGTMCNNFGGALTYYALYKYIESLGLKPVIVPPTPDSLGTVLQDNIFEKHCHIAPNYHKERNTNFNMLSNTFMIGSDQMWNYNLFKEWKFNPYLDFTFDEKKKIAYGVSLGKSSYILPPKTVLPHLKKLIGKFDHVSCREEHGLTILNDFFGLNDVTCCIDPVFLCDSKLYDDLISEVDKTEDESFVYTYTLTKTPEIIDTSYNFSNSKKLKNIVVGSGNAKRFESVRLELPMVDFHNPISVQEWLYFVKNSKYIITNSFHGVCFSIIFKKRFCAFLDSDDIRIRSILEKCGLLDRMIIEDAKNVSMILEKPIDYDDVFQKLESYIIHSKNWLINAIKNDK